MTDRIFALTVLFDKDIREDDVESIINAIKMIKHVQVVTGHVSNIDIWAAEQRAKLRLRKKLFDCVFSEEGDK